MKADGSGRQKISSQRIIDVTSVSPDGRWIVGGAPVPGEERTTEVKAFAADGSTVVSVCVVECTLNWDMSGKFAFVSFWNQPTDSYGLPTMRTTGLPPGLPFAGKGVEELPRSSPMIPWYVESAMGPSVYAYTRKNIRRNLYRISLP